MRVDAAADAERGQQGTQPVGPGESFGPLVGIRPAQPVLQGAGDRGERDRRATEVHARSPEHVQLRIAADLTGKAGLADAGFAMDDDRVRYAGHGVEQHIAEEPLFGCASGEAMIGPQTPHASSVNTLRRADGRPEPTEHPHRGH